MPVKMDGTSWQLCDLQHAGVNIFTRNGNLCWESGHGQPTILQPYEADHDYGVKVVADITAKSATVFIDGQPRGQHLPFARAIDAIDYVLIRTGDAATGELYLGPVNIHKGYAVNETFVTCRAAHSPVDWTTGAGTATGPQRDGGEVCVWPRAGRLQPPAGGNGRKCRAGQEDFRALTAKTVFECRFLLPEKHDGMSVELGSRDAGAIRIQTANAMCLNPSGSRDPVVLAPGYRANLWYMLKAVADPIGGMADIFVNGKLVARGARFKAPGKGFDTVVDSPPAAATCGLTTCRSILGTITRPIMCRSPSRSGEDALYRGLQSCNLWREGTAYAGWDYVYPVSRQAQAVSGLV